MLKIRVYNWSELAGDDEGVIIRTQDGTEVCVQLRHGKTLVTFPFGNHVETPETVGVLATGIVALPIEPRKERANASSQT